MYDLRNQLLIATPKLHNTHLEKTVVFLFQEEQTMYSGFIVNKSSETTFQEAFEEYDIDPYQKSPISLQNTHCHKGGFSFENTYYVCYFGPQIYEDVQYLAGDLKLTSSPDVFHDLIDSYREIQREQTDFFVFTGKMRWSEKQLYNEISNNFWLTIHLENIDLKALFAIRDSLKWQYIINKIGFYQHSYLSASYGNI